MNLRTLQYLGIEMLNSLVYLEFVFRKQIHQLRLRQPAGMKMTEDGQYESLAAREKMQDQEQAAYARSSD